MCPVRRQISPHASRLRRNATDVEQKIWAVLRNRQLLGFKFRRQATIGPFVVDFLCVEAALVIELDGGQHNDEADASRTVYLESKGLRIIRFWNHDVIENFDGVIDAVSFSLKEKKDPHPTSPAKAGEE